MNLEIRRVELEELKEELLLYDFQIDERELESLLENVEDPVMVIRTTNWYLGDLKVERVLRVYPSLSGRVKLVVLPKNRVSLMGSGLVSSPSYWEGVIWKGWLSDSDIPARVREGSFLISDSSGRILFLMDTTDEKEVKEMVETIKYCQSLSKEYSKLPELNLWRNDWRLKTKGTITPTEVRDLKERLEGLVEKGLAEEEKEAKRLEELLRTKVKVRKEGDLVVTEIEDALDGHNYIFKTEGELPRSFLKEQVFLHRTSLTNKKQIEENKLFPERMWWYLERQDSFVMGVDGRTVKVEKTKNRVGSTIWRINGKITKGKYLRETLKSFLYGNPEALKEKATRTGLSSEAKGYLESGIEGEIRDLEGQFPFTLQFRLEKKKWYLVVGGKEYYLKGGLGMIRKIKSVITGTTNSSEKAYSSMEFYNRLGKVIGKKDALEIVKLIKAMGTLKRSLEG